MKIRLYSTTKEKRFVLCDWTEKKQENSDTALTLTEESDQIIKGFGGCFNELGWIALNKLPKEKKTEILDLLFSPEEDGLCFNFCRMPIGASDYAAKWYSHNEVDGDYRMEHHSISRDKIYLLPYIKEAFKRRPDMKMFASPWSPPCWMKFPQVYNYGKLKWTEENLQAYALYFARFVEAYRDEGITINQIHVQNEPMVSQKFPSCEWTGEELAEFIGEYLGPCFEERNIDSEIWLGTLNGPEPDFFRKVLITGYNDYANLVLHDRNANRFVKGVGYQWAGKYAIQQTHESRPDLALMQTENECGEGKNSWEYARYVFDLFRHYLSNGVNAYIYWNMVLEEGGDSTWGWKQNSPITVDPEGRGYKLNYEYYVMKHFSSFIEKGAVRMKLSGPFSSNAVAFRNKNGNLILVIFNPFSRRMSIDFKIGTERVNLMLQPDSFNTVIITE